MEKRWVYGLLKKEPVLIISVFLALVSMIVVPPSARYAASIDWQTIAVLFALMLIVSGFEHHRVLKALSDALLTVTADLRGVAFSLVALTFFSSMLITNDVALITFVPLTIIAFTGSGEERSLRYVIILETIAANVGSALTPVGNPQNLFLYNHYRLSAMTIARVMLPYVVSALILLTLLLLAVPRTKSPKSGPATESEALSALQVTRYLALFAVAIATVFHRIPWPLGVTIVAVASEKRLYRTVDYSLLATFIALFILVGNLSSLPSVETFFAEHLKGREFFLSLALSQVLSNVPATLLLSQFTDNALELLKGVNVGGCGTLIASMASVISFRLFSTHTEGKTLRYLLLFSLLNILFLLLFITLHRFF